MHLLLSSIIAMVVFTPLAADDGCRCRFKGLRGTVDLFKYHTAQTPFLHDALVGLPPTLNFEVDFQLGQAWFYPETRKSGRVYNIYIQDLKTNTMYIYPHTDGRPTGTCRNVTMPKGLIVPSCLPANPPDISRPITGGLLYQSRNQDDIGYSYSYLVNSHDTCEPLSLMQYMRRNGWQLELYLKVLQTGLDFTNETPRFKLDSDNCQEEDLDNLFYRLH